MKTLFLFPLIVLLFGQNVMAQNRGHHHEEIAAKKVAFITTEMGLNTAEAQKFWPVYNEYTEAMHQLRHEQRSASKAHRENLETLSDQELESDIRKKFELDRKELEVREKYFEEFKSVLPMNKLAQFYTLEHEFKRKLLREMRENCKRSN